MRGCSCGGVTQRVSASAVVTSVRSRTVTCDAMPSRDLLHKFAAPRQTLRLRDVLNRLPNPSIRFSLFRPLCFVPPRLRFYKDRQVKLGIHPDMYARHELIIASSCSRLEAVDSIQFN